ncbi:MAG: WYL domain-containing protein [Lentisphaeria bacterium]|nr:WYL domain-containing protein [Lentisphaeria bacterium]
MTGFEKKLEKVPVNQRERLKFIEFRLYWEEAVNRKAITGYFQISDPQASLDLKLYQELCPGSLDYDLSGRCYRPSKTFKPRLTNPSAKEYLDCLLNPEHENHDAKLGNIPLAERVPTFGRPVSPEIIRVLTEAMQREHQVKIKYHSPRSPEATNRVIAPLALVYTLERWHVRSFCFLRDDFRSFVLGRMLDISAAGEPQKAVPLDKNWEARVEVVIKPSKQLEQGATAIIEQEYDMSDGQAKRKVRIAQLQYFLHENCLLDSTTAEPSGRENIRPDNGQIRIENLEEVKAALSQERGQ